MTKQARRHEIKTLRLRLRVHTAEFATCTTDAMRKCVQETIDEWHRQLRVLGA
jgi:hypothetical protein